MNFNVHTCIFRSSDSECGKSNASSVDSFVFDKASGKFKVNVKMTPKDYGLYGHEHIADIGSLSFEQTTGQFVVPLLLSPAEYGDYVND